MKLVSALLYDDVDAHRLFQVDTVIIDEPFGLKAPVVPFRDRRPELCFRHFEEAIEAREDVLLAEFGDEFAQPFLAQPVGAQLSADVAEHEFRRAAVGADEPLDVAVGPVGALVAHGGQVQAFVENLSRLARAASRHWPADVALVRDRAAEAEQLAADEDRRDDRDVRRVWAAAVVGVIDDEGVALRDAVAERIDDGGGAGGECADVQRQDHVLRHHVALRVHQRAGCILRFPHDGGEAGAEQRILHLLHDAGEARLQHFEIDRVDGHCFSVLGAASGRTEVRHGDSGRNRVHHPSCVTIRFFHSSIRPTWPGRITVVQSSCARIAGPARLEPTSSCSR